MFRRNLLALEKLVIVESPNKVIKVEDLLSNAKVIPDWSFKKGELSSISKGPEKAIAMATTGHFMFLKELNWKPQSGKAAPPKEEEFPPNGVLCKYSMEWEILAGRRIQETVAQYMDDKAKDISEIIIATDPDREGELIAVHVLNLIKLMYPKSKIPFSRAYMHSITEEGIQFAMENRSANFDHNLANAAEARHAMDRMFGFLGSSVVRYANPQLRSIGRVQTPALILVNKREERIERYLETHKTHYALEALCTFTSKTGTSHTQAVSITPKAEDSDVDWEDKGSVESAMYKWKVGSGRSFQCVSPPVKQTVTSDPPEPFTMATLIAKANRQLRMTSETASSSLQDLFQMGFITYPRTDSSRIDESALPAIYEAVKSTYGKNMVYKLQDRDGSSKKAKKGKRKTDEGNVEDAHEAIRPTDMSLRAEKLGMLSDTTKQVYDLVYRHTLACFMIPMKTDKVSATIQFTGGAGKEMVFSLQGKHASEPGGSLAYRVKGSNALIETDDEMEDRENGKEVVRTVSSEEFRAILDMKDLGSAKKVTASLERPQTVKHEPRRPSPTPRVVSSRN
ncbi:DNA topoisomerase I [Angomonas deanei]|nr:DNA topoisomerase I [Angomonas deanei]|eukprot:EPY25170.1 DNA topoisomerase I [Angomonas deanei]